MAESALGADEVAVLKREGEEHLAAGRVDEARKRFSEAMRLAPRDVDARDGLVRCALAFGDAALASGARDGAISHYQIALELAPFHPQADAGLRKAAELSKERSDGDAFGAALEAMPPVRAIRDLQVADRVVGKLAGTAPSQMLRDSVGARRARLAASGVPPRALRMDHERAAAWRRRWIYRLLPVAVLGVALALWLATGSFLVLNWGFLLGLFALAWDLIFVERGAKAAAGLEAASEPR